MAQKQLNAIEKKARSARLDLKRIVHGLDEKQEVLRMAENPEFLEENAAFITVPMSICTTCRLLLACRCMHHSADPVRRAPRDTARRPLCLPASEWTRQMSCVLVLNVGYQELPPLPRLRRHRGTLGAPATCSHQAVVDDQGQRARVRPQVLPR